MYQQVKKLLKNPLVVFLLFLVLILIIFKMLLGNTTNQISDITPIPTPSPIVDNNIVNQTPLITTTPQYQGEPNFRIRIDKEIREAYPLFNQTPFSTENWSIDYTNKMEVTVALKQDTPEIRQEVLDWMTDRGADPKSHKIIWKTVPN